MSKTVDVDLRIRAKNLAGKTLADINGQVETLTASQKKLSTAADLAAKSTRDLAAEQGFLAATTRELSRRRDLVNQFQEQRTQIGATAAKIKDLTAAFREMQRGSGGKLIGFSDKDTKALGREIIALEASLTRLTAKNAKTGESLKALGVDTSNVKGALVEIEAAVVKSSAAYDRATQQINNHSAASERAAQAAQEAARRQVAAAAEVRRAQEQSRTVGGRAAELAALRQDIEQRSAQRLAIEAVGEAARRTSQEQLEAAGRVRAAQEQARAAGTRASELAALRQDIELRSAQARAVEIAAEAQRRNAQEERAATEARQRAVASIREIAAAEDRRRQMREDAIAAFGPEFAAQERSIGVRNRLIALLNTERGQRLLSAEAQRRETAETNKNTAAHKANDSAVRSGAAGMGLFDDVGRKSLGTYQRLRGQVLGLAAAYIGFYQIITTAQKAIEATNKQQSLKVSLDVINPGAPKQAAEDMKFLREEADRLGLVFDDIAPKFANISIGAKAAGFSRGQTKAVFSDLQLITAGLNLTTEAADRVNYAVTQVFSKGKVMTEELSGQLGDVLPGAMAKFAEANNIAMNDLAKHLKDGKGSLGEFVTFLDQYAKQFEGSMAQITGRLQGQINRATNAYNDFLRQLLSGANNEKLSEAFKRISTFFRSDDGAAFADKLATAFGKAIDVFIFLADNADSVGKALKAIIAVQILKFMADIYLSFVRAGTAIIATTKNIVAARVAYVAAEGATVALTAKTRLLGLAFGPVGIAIAAVTAFVFSYIASIDKATERTRDYIQVLDTLGTRQGIAKAMNFDESIANVKEAETEVRKLREEVEELNDAADNKNFGFTMSGFKGAFGQLPGGALTPAGQEQERAKRAARILELEKAISFERDVVQPRLLARELAEDEARKKEGLAPPSRGGGTEDAEKGPKGPSAETLAKREMADANARANASRALNAELLDLDQKLFDAQIDGSIKTAAQIDKNYELTIKKIESQIAEMTLGLDRLAQNAQTAAGPGQDISAQDKEAIESARRKIEELNLVLNTRAMESAQISEIELKEKAINDLIESRNSKIALANTLQETGAITATEAYRLTLAAQDEANGNIQTLSQELITLLQTITPDTDLYAKLGVDKTIAGLQQINAEAAKLTTLQRFGQTFGPQLASGFANAFGVFAQGIAGAIEGTNSLGDAFEGAMDSFRNFAADFLMQIAQMIVQALVLYAIQVMTGTAPSGGFSIASVFAPKQHSGGIVGRDRSGTARVSPLVFAGAQRFHGGGLPGLKPSEVATVLERGEEVLTEDNPRHIGNMGNASAPGAVREPDVTVINTMDSASIVQQGFATGSTRRVILNDVKANQSAWRRALGVNG